MNNKWLRTLLVATVLLLSACSNSSLKTQNGDGAPSDPIDVSQIPDAVPKLEAKSKYGNPPYYEVLGKRYSVMDTLPKNYKQRGKASWYGTKFHGRRTSSGETYNMYTMTAAHKTLPLPSYARVTNLDNGRQVIVKINDRGPFHHERIIDLSYAAARKLGVFARGTANVEIETILPEKGYSLAKNTATASPKINNPVAKEVTRPKNLVPIPKIELPPTKTIASIASQNIYLQVGAFNTRPQAEQLAIKVKKLGAHPVQIIPAGSTKDALYRVHVGPFPSREMAEKFTEKLISSKITQHGFVIT